MGAVASCCGCGGPSKQGYEPLLLDTEREAVADLLQYLESELRPPSYSHARLTNS